MFGKNKVGFLVIGAQKSGTSSFFQYLSSHPGIIPGKNKEIHFFDFFHDKSRRWYHSHFDFKRKKIAGEASPFYLLHPHCPQRVKNYNPRMKIIALLRDPVERAVSHYRMNLENASDQLPFSQAIRTEEERLEASYDPDQLGNPLLLYSYKTRGRYAEQLTRWAKFFPKEQIMVLNYHRFFEDPWREIQPVYRFLQLDSHYGRAQSFRNNVSKTTFEPAAEDLAYLKTYFEEPNRQLAKQYDIHFG